jgi:hypothetical protein
MLIINYTFSFSQKGTYTIIFYLASVITAKNLNVCMKKSSNDTLIFTNVDHSGIHVLIWNYYNFVLFRASDWLIVVTWFHYKKLAYSLFPRIEHYRPHYTKNTKLTDQLVASSQIFVEKSLTSLMKAWQLVFLWSESRCFMSDPGFFFSENASVHNNLKKW